MPKSGGFVIALLLTASALAAQAPRPPVRELKVLVIADEEYQKQPRWVPRTFEMIKTASADFEELFGIRLVARPFESWRSDDQLRRLDQAAELLARDFERYGSDLLIVMSGQEWTGDWRMTYAMYREGLIVLAPPPNLVNLGQVLKRLLGHLFGAVTTPPDHSAPPRDPGLFEFSAANREIILLNRDRTFNRPDSPSFPVATERAVEIYRSICASIDAAAAAKEAARSKDLAGQGEAQEDPPIRLAGGPTDAHLLLAQLYLNAGQLDEAMTFCVGALTLNPDDLEAQNTLGIIYRRTGDPGAAIAKYLDVFRRDPQFARVLFNLGVAYSQQGDFRNAAGAYEAALSLRPAYAEAYNNIGDVRLREGRFDEAEALFRKAVAANPAFALARSNLAEVLIREGDYAGAGAEADEAARLDPGSAAAIVIQGNVDRGLGRVAEAVEHYLRARSLDPKNAIAAVNLGICAFERGDLAESEKLFRETLALTPDMAEAHAGLGACLLRRSELDEAKQELGTALTLGLNSAEVHLNLSSVALEKKKYDEAIAEAKLALGLNAGPGRGLSQPRRRVRPERHETGSRGSRRDGRPDRQEGHPAGMNPPAAIDAAYSLSDGRGKWTGCLKTCSRR